MAHHLPAAGAGTLASADERARVAAAQLTSEGMPVRYVRSIYVTEDETCFHVCEGASADAVEAACRRAALWYDRIVEAAE